VVTQYLRYSLLLLVALFPILTGSVSHGGSVIYLLLILIGVVTAWPSWKKLSRLEKNILLGYCLFVFVALLSMVNADDGPSNIKRLERLLRFLAIVPVYLLVRSVKFDLLKSLLVGSGVGCIVLASQAWYAVSILGVIDVHGAYHKIYFGDTAMLLVTVVAAGVFTVAKKRWQVGLGSICIAAGLYASVLSGTRGAWLLLPLLLPVYFYLYRHLFNVKRTVLVATSLLLLVSFSDYWVPNSMAARINQGVEEIRLYQSEQKYHSSLGSRINMWRDCVTMFLQHPFLGVGLGDFRWERKKLMNSGAAIVDSQYDHAHNIYLDSLATTGLLGLLALLFCLFILPLKLLNRAWCTWQHHDWDRFAILAGICTLLAFAVFGLSEGWLSRNPFINTYGIFVAVLVASVGRFLSDVSDTKQQSEPNPNHP